MRTITYTNTEYQQLSINENGISIEPVEYEQCSYELYKFDSVDELESIIADLQDLRLTMKPLSEQIKEKLENVVLPN